LGERSELRKAVLGLRECMLICIGGMIGIAVFVLSSITATLAGPSAVLIWVVAGGLMFIIALNFAELATAFPRAGGIYVYPYETFGGGSGLGVFVSHLTGWLYWFTFGVLANVIGAIFIGQYVAIFIPGAAAYSTYIAVVVLVFVWALNLVGVVPTGIVNTILTACLIAIMLIYVCVGLPAVNLAYYHPFISGYMGSRGFLVGVTIAWLGYTAWISITSIAEEIKEPQKTIPKAISFAIFAVASIYFLVLFVTFGLAPWSEFTEKNPFGYYSPFSYAASKLGVPWVTPLVSLAAILAITTTMIVLVLDSSRVLLAMGRTGMLPTIFSRVNERFKTPWFSLTFLTVVSIAFVTQPPWVVQYLIQMGGGSFGVIIFISCICVIYLRRWRPEVKAKFRMRGSYILPLAAMCIIGVAMTQYDSIVYYLTGGWIAIGCIYYLLRYLTKSGVFKPKA